MKWAPRFRLRTLFVLVTVCALVLSFGLWIRSRGQLQRRAFDEVYRLGGGAGFEPNRVPTEYDWCFCYVAFVNINTNVDDADLVVLDQFPELQSLGLSYTSISDRAVERIVRLRSLKALDLSGTAITDESVPYISQLASLETLTLRETAISDAGLEELKRSLPRTEIAAHVMRRCRGCSSFYLTRRVTPANLCPECQRMRENNANPP